MKKILSATWLLLIPVTLWAQPQPVGSVAVYSDGSVEKLIQINAQSTTWQDGRKRILEYANVPILQRRSFTKFPATESYQEHIAFGVPAEIIPFGTADSVIFTLRREFSEGGHTMRYWQCAHKGQGQYQLGERTLATERYHCERYVPHKKSMYSMFRESVDLAYSPDLSMVVEKVRKTQTKKTRRKLVSLLAPEQVSEQKILKLVKRIHEDKS